MPSFLNFLPDMVCTYIMSILFFYLDIEDDLVNVTKITRNLVPKQMEDDANDYQRLQSEYGAWENSAAMSFESSCSFFFILSLLKLFVFIIQIEDSQY